MREGGGWKHSTESPSNDYSHWAAQSSADHISHHIEWDPRKVEANALKPGSATGVARVGEYFPPAWWFQHLEWSIFMAEEISLHLKHVFVYP